MIVTILGPTTKKIIPAVAWLQATTTEGSYTILPKHAPLTAPLALDTTVSLGFSGGLVESIAIKRGILHVDREQITILLDELSD